MPLYEYECRKCGAHTEVIQKVTDKLLTKCRKCGGRLEKLLSAPAIQFKGAGWYVTDYAGRKSEAKADGEAGGDSKAESQPEAKETKPDTKPDPAPAAKKTPKAESPSKGMSAD